MFCGCCGAHLEIGAAYCPSCGAPLPRSRGIGSWLRLSIGVLGLSVVGALVAALLYSPSEPRRTQSRPVRSEEGDPQPLSGADADAPRPVVGEPAPAEAQAFLLDGIIEIASERRRDRAAALGNPQLLSESTSRRSEECRQLVVAFRERYEGRAHGWVMQFTGWGASLVGHAGGGLVHRGVPFVYYLGTESREPLQPGDWIEVSSESVGFQCGDVVALIGDDPEPPYSLYVGIRAASNAHLRPLLPSDPRWSASVRNDTFRGDIAQRKQAKERLTASRTPSRKLSVHSLEYREDGPGLLGLGKAVWRRTAEVEISDVGLKVLTTKYDPSGGYSSNTTEVGYWLLSALQLKGDCLVVRYLQPAPWDPANLAIRDNAEPDALVRLRDGIRQARDAWAAIFADLAPPPGGPFEATCR